MTSINFKQAHSKNYTKGRTSNIEWIVIHYTANDGDTAKNNVDYFSGEVPNHTSAHYFVDSNSIWQSVKEEDTAHAVGGAKKYYNECRNDNSISIEMCNSLNTVNEKTKQNVIELTLSLMEKYNIDVNHVVRHYDVTHKNCPAPWVKDESKWEEFKNDLMEDEEMTQEKFNEMLNNYFNNLATQEPSDWGDEWENAKNWAESNNLIQGNERDEKMYKSFLTRQQMTLLLYRYNNLQ